MSNRNHEDTINLLVDAIERLREHDDVGAALDAIAEAQERLRREQGL